MTARRLTPGADRQLSEIAVESPTAPCTVEEEAERSDNNDSRMCCLHDWLSAAPLLYQFAIDRCGRRSRRCLWAVQKTTHFVFKKCTPNNLPQIMSWKT